MNYAKLFTRRKDGRYCASFMENGRRRYLYDKDPEALYHKLEAARHPTPLRFGQLVEEWKEAHGAAVGWKTAESYIAPCRRIVGEFGEDLPEEITAAQLQAFLSALGKRGYARRTVQLHHDILSMVFDACILRGVVTTSPMAAVSVPKNLATTKRTVPEDDALEAVRTRTDAPFSLFALLCLYCGLRRGEALALRHEDIDRRLWVLRVSKAVEFVGNQPEIKTPKTATGVREVPVPLVLRSMIPKGEGYLFTMDDGSPVTKMSFRRRWEAYCKAIGHNITAHQLRHGYATYLYEAGVPVLAAQKMLGHANASTTMNIYTHLRRQQEESAADLLNKYLSVV